MKNIISVVIPVFNRRQTIIRAMESVLRQTYQSFDLWIVDDASTDGTVEIIKDYIKGSPMKARINLLTMGRNGGVSAARNRAINESRGEWVAFLDSDDEWLPEKLERQVALIKKNPNLRLIHGEEIWIRRGVRVNQGKVHRKSGGDIFINSLKLCLISPSASMVKRKLFDEVGTFDENYPVCEDYDLWLKITSLYPVGFIEEPIIIKYGGHEDQLSRRYFAMDYWRIKSMDRVLSTRRLSDHQRTAVCEEIVRKGKILLSGYQKHNNLSNYAEIERIINHCTLANHAL